MAANSTSLSPKSCVVCDHNTMYEHMNLLCNPVSHNKNAGLPQEQSLCDSKYVATDTTYYGDPCKQGWFYKPYGHIPPTMGPCIVTTNADTTVVTTGHNKPPHTLNRIVTMWLRGHGLQTPLSLYNGSRLWNRAYLIMVTHFTKAGNDTTHGTGSDHTNINT